MNCFIEKEEDQDKLWTLVKRMQALDLTVEEQAIASALAITIAGKYAYRYHVGYVGYGWLVGPILISLCGMLLCVVN